MPRDIVVVFVHGINVTSQDYYVAMRDRILDLMPPADREYVTFSPVFWADIVRGHQQDYMLYAEQKQRHMAGNKLRRLVIEGLGDAAAYQKTPWTATAYYRIQDRLRNALRHVSNGPNDRRPLVMIGHSLGCHIISTYAWDLHRCKPKNGWPMAFTPNTFWTCPPDSPLERLDTFAGFVTMGSNMPLFAFTFGQQNVFPITHTHPNERDFHHPAFPGANLDPDVAAKAHWLNFFSVNDPLGYPLKPLNDAYDEEPRLTDIHTPSEGWLAALFARFIGFRELMAVRAHSGYWTDCRVARGTAGLLSNIINAGYSQPPRKPFWPRQ